MMRLLLIAFAMLLLAPAAQAQDLAHETAQVDDLRSIREIKRLQAEWGYRAIAGDWKGMAALGTEYVEMVLPGGNREGREAVENGLRQLFGGADGIPAGRLNLQMWFSPVITLAADGSRATVRWRRSAPTMSRWQCRAATRLGARRSKMGCGGCSGAVSTAFRRGGSTCRCGSAR